jgi:hypothetical protein
MINMAKATYPGLIDHSFNRLNSSVLVVSGEIVEHSERSNFSAPTIGNTEDFRIRLLYR